MLVRLHSEATTTPKIRAEIQASNEAAWVLADRHGISEQTVYKWRHRDSVEDKSHTPHRLQTTLTPAQEAVAVSLRQTLLLPLDDLLAVVREFLNPNVSRSGLDRCLRRHGVSNLRELKGKAPKPKHSTFKAYEPGYIHIDVKYLPQMQDETKRRYLFVAIDRATRWVFIRIFSAKSAANARRFLRDLERACPLKIRTILTDNGKEFTDRLFGMRKRSATGKHEFDKLCAELGIEHRLTPPKSPQTNGMVERFNGRIEDVLQGHHFKSGEDLEQTLERYVWLYNQQLPQSVLGSKTPLQAMKDWYKLKPELFKKIPYQLTGRDNYIFTDPPFGHNIQYSELNVSLEALLGVLTNSPNDLVVNEAVEKGNDFYRKRIRQAFSEYYRVLKPGRWITVEFSNTQAAIWNSIQTALSESGFVIASVAALDKKRGGMHSTLGVTAVKQDLAITAYKPSQRLESAFDEFRDPAETAWSFIEDHLRKLPVVRTKAREIQYIAERDPRILFDRMISWFVRHNVPVPLSSQEFQDGLSLRFANRDGMVFLPEQVATYDRKRTQFAQAPQMELFVSDERSAIDWLTDFLRKRPSTYQEVHPEFTTQVGAGWKKHEEKPELSALLEDNFLRFDGNGDVPSQIHSYLSSNFKDLRGLEKEDPRLKAKAKDRWYVPDPNKAKDLEQKRERSLLKEFEAYKTANKRQLKESRLEVLRAGFKTAWAAKDYKTIIGIAEKLPDETLQEDEKLLLWYDQALTRTEADA